MRILLRVVGSTVVFYVVPAHGGSYTGSSTLPGTFGPTIVTHTYRYTGAPGINVARICAHSTADPVLVPAIQSAIGLWNARTVSNNNCSGPCLLFREADQAGPYFFEMTVLHEIGHCAFGLSETYNTLPSGIAHDASNTRDEASIQPGPDFILGSSDDVVSPLPGSRVLHWFRVSDNNPFVRDGTTIDTLTYSRDFAELPAGHSWPANGNKDVAVILGIPGVTFPAMLGRASPRTTLSAFVGDDINTVEFAETGIDENAATTADNYTTQVTFEPNCSVADVEVRFESIGQLGVSGQCERSIVLVSPPTEAPRHYSLHSDPPMNVRSIITINRAFDWPVSTLPFVDGFENQPDHLGHWSSAVTGP